MDILEQIRDKRRKLFNKYNLIAKIVILGNIDFENLINKYSWYLTINEDHSVEFDSMQVIRCEKENFIGLVIDG